MSQKLVFRFATQFAITAAVFAGSALGFQPATPTTEVSTPAIAGPVVKIDWFAVELFNQRAGWSKQSETTSNGTIETESLMEFSVGRGDTAIKVRMATLFTETMEGKPLRMKVYREMAAAPVTEEYSFGAQEVTITTTTASADGKDNSTVSKQPLPEGEWLTPAKLARVAKEKIRAGEQKFSVVTIDPSSGMNIVTVEHVAQGKKEITIGDKTVEASVWGVLTKTGNGVSVAGTEYLDANSEMLQSDISLGGITMKMVRTDGTVVDRVFVAPEMMVQLFVKPDRTIPSPRQLNNATYLLSVSEGEMPALPSAGGQKFEKLDSKSGRLVASAESFVEASEEDRKNPKFLGHSAMISTNDPMIKSLTEKALNNKGTLLPRERAELLRRFVYKHISHKELGKGFAGAAEVAKTGTGDCSEHGVLLAALLRADGIPARVASGLIYADQFAGEKGIFGYHMWTQALVELDGKMRWVDLDSTLPGTRQGFDATHIAVSVTALEDGELNSSMMNLVPLLGRLEIKVEKLK